MIEKKLKLVYSFCLFAAVLGCEHKDSASTYELKKQVRVAGQMAGSLWCKANRYYSTEKDIELVTYLGLGKVSAYSLRKKPDPRQSWGYRLIAFKNLPDDRADYEYAVSPQFPAKNSPAGTPKYNLDVRPAVRKNWRETFLSPVIPEQILNSQPNSELVLRSRNYYGREETAVYHPCSNAGTSFIEFLSRDESIANSRWLALTEGRSLNARDNANSDRLLEFEWPLHEFTLSSEFVTSRRLCAVTPGYSGVNVDVYSLLVDGSIKIATLNWSNNKGTVKVTSDNPAPDTRTRWELKNGTLRMLAKSAQPWDVIGGRNIWVARGYQDNAGRTLVLPRADENVMIFLQDCERFRNPANGGLTFGPINLTGDNTKDAIDSSAALEKLYQDLNISRRN